MRQQTKAYILAHGGNPDAMTEDDFQLVMVAINDGFIGNKKILNTLGLLTSGVFNYLRKSGSTPYSLQDIIGNTFEYLYMPMTDSEKKLHTNNQLLLFMQSRQDAPEALKNVSTN